MDSKVSNRVNQLLHLGLQYDGNSFIYKDINVHWTDIVWYTDIEFDKVYNNIIKRLQQIHPLAIGMRVTYLGLYMASKGIIKSFADKHDAFVVYYCNNDWKNYKNYTAASTPITRLIAGWHTNE